MQKIVLAFIISLFFYNDSGYKILNFDYFTIKVPEKWEYIERTGIDSYIGAIAIDKKDTLSFDLGYYSSDLEESLDLVITNDSVFIPQLTLRDTIKSTEYIFYSMINDIDFNSLRKQNYTNTTIDGRKAKITFPKKIGNGGYTGVYFEDISNKKSKIRLNIIGNNLTPVNHKEFLEAIKTIKFIKK